MMPGALNGAHSNDSRQVMWKDGDRVFYRAWRLGNDGNRRAVLPRGRRHHRTDPGSHQGSAAANGSF
jgi:hypothetical protein